MASKPLLLEGDVDARARDIERLESQLAHLEGEIEMLRGQVQAAQRGVYKMLSPLYKALAPVFGDLEPLAEGTESSPSRTGAWESVKQRLAPRLREAIDILLLQNTMKRTQLASALRMDYSNCNKNVIGPLLRQGWLVDNGGNLSLKEL